MSKFNASEILVGVKSLVDLIEGEFEQEGAGEHKAGLLRDLAEGVFGEETVATLAAYRKHGRAHRQDSQSRQGISNRTQDGSGQIGG